MKKSIERFYPFLIFLIAFLLYANTIPNDYCLDDELVTINHRTSSKGFAGIKEIFSSFYYEDDQGYKYGYRPITHLSFAIEHQFFGESAHVSHAINVFLYAFLSLLLFFLVNRLAPDKGPLLALIVSLIFIIHPIHSEVVASIKNRDELLSLLFGLSSLFLVFTKDSDKINFRNFMFWLLSILLFGIGFLSKSSITPMVFLLPLGFILIRKYVNITFPLLFLNTTFFIVFKSIDLPLDLSISLLMGSNLLLISLKVYFNGFLSKSIKKVKDFPIRESLGKRTWEVSILLYIVLISLGLVFEDDTAIITGFILYILLNDEKIGKARLTHLPILIVSSLAIFLLHKTDPYAVTVIILTVLYVSNLYFKPLWLLAIVGLGAAVSGASFWIVPQFIAAVLLILPFALGRYFKLRVFAKLEKFKMVFVLVFFITSLFSIDYTQRLISESQSVNIPRSTISSIDIDRPVSEIENPIISHWDPEHRAALSLNTNRFYLQKLLVPFPLSFYYGYDQIKIYNFKDWQTIVSLVTLLLLIGIGLFLFFKGQYLALFALLSLELSVIPYSNLIVPVAGIVGERLAFTASFGFSLLLGLCFYTLYKRLRMKWLMIGFGAIIFIASADFVLHRNTLWKDRLTLFQHDIKDVQNSAQAHALLASACMTSRENSASEYSNEELVAMAIVHFEKALEIYPDFFNWQFDLGRVYFFNGHYQKAKGPFQRAAELDSSYTDTYRFLIDIANSEGNVIDLITYCTLVLQQDPNNINDLMNLSEALYAAKKYEQVIVVNNKIIDVDNTIPEAYLNKALAYIQLLDLVSAKKQLEYVRLLSPTHQGLAMIERELDS